MYANGHPLLTRVGETADFKRSGTAAKLWLARVSSRESWTGSKSLCR